FLRIKGDVYEVIRRMVGRAPGLVRDVRDGFHPGKTAGLFLEEREVATFGKVDPRYAKALDIPFSVYLANVYIDVLPDYVPPDYVAPSKYPSTYRDLALTVSLETTATLVEQTIVLAIGDLCTAVRVFDEYRGPQVGEDKKSLAVRITLQRADATITDEEADAAIAKALD